ncbi:anthranilate synthase component I family protein [Rhizobium sp. CRIBSB]|nr:anthranilate synthase component I family protein [Rhizobium sp. CRIBSB]
MTGRVRAALSLPWREPLAVAAGLGARDGLLTLLSGTGTGRSWIGCEPETIVVTRANCGLFDTLRAPGWDQGVVGLAAYDGGARAATGERDGDWPDLILGRYPGFLAFDADARSVTAYGWGEDEAGAQVAAERAAQWLETAGEAPVPEPPSNRFDSEAEPQAYADAVAQVIDRIAAGDLFQANIARAWSGRLRAGAAPFDLFLRMSAAGGSAYGAYWRIGDRALVSNSPELFLTLEPEGRIEARPIKGTRPRDPDPHRDAALAAELLASAKERAENLMIVDLMRNDLARVAVPGTVAVERLFEIQSLPTVHHLVSTVTGQAVPGAGPADVLEATFPPGSITGAPKHQAMKLIAAHEQPRGPWCGSLFMLDDRGGLTASVLIRTVSLVRDGEVWRWRTLAGAGITADSDPAAELAETGDKIAAIRAGLVGDQLV